MRACPKCGHVWDEPTRFCRSCGEALTNDPPEVRAKWDALQRRVTANPNCSDPLVESAEFLLSLSRVAEAKSYLERAIAVDANSPIPRRRLAEVHLRLGEWDDAAVQLLFLVEHAPSDGVLLEMLADAYIKAGRLQSAIKPLSQLSDLRPMETGALLRLVDVGRTLDDKDLVLASCREIVKRDPSNPIWIPFAETLLATGELDGAAAAFHRVLEIAPTHPVGNLFLGRRQFRAAIGSRCPEDLRGVAERLSRGVANPTAVPESELQRGSFELGVIRALLGEAREDAEVLLGSLRKQELDDGDISVAEEAWSSLGEEWLSAGELARAVKCTERALALSNSKAAREKHGQVLLLLAQGLAESGDLEGAVARAEQALATLDSEDAREFAADVRTRSGDRLLASDNGNAALAQYRAALEVLGRDDVALRSKIESLTRRTTRARRLAVSITLAISLAAAATAAYWYLAHGVLVVDVSPASALTLSDSDGIVVASAKGGNLQSGMLSSGKYLLVAESDSGAHERLEEPISIPVGRGFTHIRRDMTPIYGRVLVNSDPLGATVTVTNEFQKVSCTTPCRLPAALALPTDFVVSLEGHESFSVSKSVPARGELDLGTIHLTGALHVASNPDGARVYLDGSSQPRGSAPLRIEGLPSGSHSVVLRKEGFVDKEVKVRVRGGETADLGRVRLESFEEQQEALERARLDEIDKVAVRDSRTRLMWQKSGSQEKFGDGREARDYCQRLSVAGFHDWRVPSFSEALNIVRGTSLFELNPFSGYPNTRIERGPGHNGCYMDSAFDDCDTFIAGPKDDWSARFDGITVVDYEVGAYNASPMGGRSWRVRCVRNGGPEMRVLISHPQAVGGR